MTKTLDRGKRSRDSKLESTVIIYCDMLLGRNSGVQRIACPEQLERSRLDFSLASLHAIDGYLVQVRAKKKGLDGVVYLNTVVAIACYLGECVRRGTPEGECLWIRTPAGVPDSAHTAINLGDFANIVLSAKELVQPLRLTHVVARIVSNAGRQALTYEYAVVAMKRIWISATTKGR